MGARIFVFLFFLFAVAHGSTMKFTAPRVSAAGATDLAYFEVWSPACETAALRHDCNKFCANITLCPPAQHWDAVVLPSVANMTKCGFTFHTSPGEITGPWSLGAVVECA